VSKDKKSWKFDAAGWLFFLAMLLVLVAPCIAVAWRFIYPAYTRWYPVVTGIVVAAIGAGTVSWAVNAVLQWRQKKQRIARRKKAKKQR
jgi:xanthine/uracil permease